MKRLRTMWTAFPDAGLLVLAAILAVSATVGPATGAEVVTPWANQSSQGTAEALAASASSTVLASGPVSVTLSSSSQQSTLVSRLNSLASGERIYLVLKGMAAQEQPGVLYHVYIDLPAGSSTPAKDDPHFVGVINFYNARAEASPTVFRSFEITDLLRNLQKQDLLSDPTTVTIVPSPGGAINANAKPVIGRIELVVQANPS